jgi:hypothetical protein
MNLRTFIDITNALGRYSAKALSRMARDRHPGSVGFAEAIVIAYNVKCKRKLSMDKLSWSMKKRRGAPPPDFEE